MSKYFQMWFDWADSDYADFELDKPLYEHFGERVPFFSGKPLKKSFPHTIVSLKAKPNAPDYIGVGSLDLVSRSLRDFLIEQDVNAEFLEVEIIQEGRSVVETYFAMNVLDVFACLDRQRSAFQESVLSSGESFISGIDELHLDESKIHGSRLFVMDERPIRLVSADLVDSLRAKKFSGLGFKELPIGPF